MTILINITEDDSELREDLIVLLEKYNKEVLEIEND